jgi:putative FmdB family regulatory protein
VPIYEYECGNCRCHFDRRQSFADEAVAACPECQGRAHRIMRSVPVIFKGSGFYVTDSRKGSDTGSAGGDAGGAKDTAKKDIAKDTGKGKGKGSAGSEGPAPAGH